MGKCSKCYFKANEWKVRRLINKTWYYNRISYKLTNKKPPSVIFPKWLYYSKVPKEIYKYSCLKKRNHTNSNISLPIAIFPLALVWAPKPLNLEVKILNMWGIFWYDFYCQHTHDLNCLYSYLLYKICVIIFLVADSRKGYFFFQESL